LDTPADPYERVDQTVNASTIPNHDIHQHSDARTGNTVGIAVAILDMCSRHLMPGAV
jgi:hypothetical protein